MEVEGDRMNPGEKPQRINIRSQRGNEIITDARLAAFIKIPAFPKIILRFIEDLNPHRFCASNRAFTSSHS